MGDGTFFFAVLIVLFLVIAPILGMIAFFRTQWLTRELKELRLTAARRWELDALPRPYIQESMQPFPAPPPAPEPPPTPKAPPAPEPPPAAQPPLRTIEPPYVPEPHPQLVYSSNQPSTNDIESVIGGKWLNVIGLIAVLIATAFFLKFAFDNNWIGPLGRITIGLLAGAAAIVISQFILKRGWTYFSEGITALGAGILYLSLYAAWNFYALINTETAFGGMAAVTASLIILSLARDSQRLAMLALIGGYVTPLLVSTGHDAQIQLFSYLTLLNAGLLWMALARDWRSLPGSFVFTLLYGAVWYSSFYNPDKLVPSLVFATIFFLEFALLPAIQARRSGVLRADAIALTLLNAAWYLTALDAMLYSTHRWVLTAGVLAVAAFYLALANITARRADLTQPAARPIFGSVALTCVTVSIPIRLEGQWIAMAWAFEGAILIWNGFKAEVAWLRAAGLIVLAGVALDVWFNPIPADRPFLNGRFATFAVTAVMLGISAWLARRYDTILSDGERVAFKVADIGSNVFALWALIAETWMAFGPRTTTVYYTWFPAQLFATTFVGGIYACILAVVGVLRDRPLARYQAYVLFMFVIFKSLFLDFSVPFGVNQPFANMRFLTSIVVFAALGVTLLLSLRHASRIPEGERPVLRAFTVLLNVFGVWALSVEVWNSFGPLAQQLGLSLVWTAYAGILIVIGIRRESALIRWQALVLFGFVILKVVAVDLSTLAIGYRIASFFALGVILLGASFLYQRRLFGLGRTKP